MLLKKILFDKYYDLLGRTGQYLQKHGGILWTRE